MQWVLIVWLAFSPETTGTISMEDEDSCLRVLDSWESISPNHEGICVYGNYKEIANEQINRHTK
jgi:hypothetical protein